MKPYYECDHGILYHGDCLEIMPELPKVDLVLTDPPYGMIYQSSWRIDKFNKIENDSDLLWIPEFLKFSFEVLKENTHIYLFCNDYNMSELIIEGEKVGFKRKRSLVWVKNNHTSGDLEGDYANKTEFVVFFHKGRKLLNGKREENVLSFKRKSCDIHPTQKPIDLMGYFINKSSDKGQTILDPFAGSGTTALACINTGRRFILIEKEKEYCDIIVKRLEQHLSQKTLLDFI
jgi:site-specific DNA-methyltransferase (adenine-specific)